MQRSLVIVGSTLFLFLAMLGGADYWWKERFRPVYTEGIAEDAGEVEEVMQKANTGFFVEVPESGSQATIAIASSAASIENGMEVQGTQSSSGKKIVKKGTSTKKRMSPNVEEVFVALQLIPKETTEMSLLKLIDQSPSVKTVVLLRNNDRAFQFSWIESDEVKSIFSGVKKALQEQFSGLVKDLVDQTTESATGTPMDVLSFLDPSISKEKIVFLRVRNRLYEIHIAKNGEEMLESLKEALGK